MAGRPTTPLVRLEEARVEWRARKRELLSQGRITPSVAAAVAFMDDFIRETGVLLDSARHVTTIFGTTEGVYSETVERQYEEIRARRDFRRVG
jgi:hypothetical protein